MPLPNTFYTQKDYGFAHGRATAGQIEGMGSPQTRSYRNAATSRPQSFTLTPAAGGYTGGAASSYAINVTLPTAEVITLTVSYPSAPFPHTVVQLSNAIILAFNSNQRLFGLATASRTGDNVMIRGRGQGQSAYNQPAFSNWATSIAVVNTGGVAVASTTLAAQNPSIIPYARVVSYEPGDPDGTARLAETTAAVSVGLSYLDHNTEQIGRFEEAMMGVIPGKPFAVIKKTLKIDGYWMPVVESVVSPRTNTTVYSICGGVNAGKLSTTPGADRKTEPNLRFVSNATTDGATGEPIVIVEATFPQGN
jgi:hypothetical protein